MIQGRRGSQIALFKMKVLEAADKIELNNAELFYALSDLMASISETEARRIKPDIDKIETEKNE